MSEWIPIYSGVQPGSVLCSLFIIYIRFILLFILYTYTSIMFELVENRQYAYAYESTLFAVVGKPADRPAVAAYLNWDLD